MYGLSQNSVWDKFQSRSNGVAQRTQSRPWEQRSEKTNDRLGTIHALPKGQEIVVGVEQREFPLSPGLRGQMTVGMDGDVVVQQRLVEVIDMIGSNINLPIIGFGIQLGEGEEVHLNMVFLHHQIPLKIAVAPHLKTQLDIIRRGDGFIAHRQFGVDGGEHGGGLGEM